jgi:hypothetical protein
MRFAALGTAAVALMVAVFFMEAALVLPFQLGLPGSKIARPWALESIASIEKSVAALEEAAGKKDWAAMQEHASQIGRGLNRLEAGPSLHALTTSGEPPTNLELREHLKATKESLSVLEKAIRDKDTPGVESTLQQFRKAYEPLSAAAKRAGK